MIECINLYKSYYQAGAELPVLSDISFKVEANAFVAMMGKSGSGKTTMLNILGLIDQLSSGQYYLNGNSMLDLNNKSRASLRNSWLGFIFQHFFLLPRLTVKQNILLPLQYNNGEITIFNSGYEKLMQRLKIADLADKYPAQLSGGQQQRVAICRALICKPKVLLADEPTGALDQDNSQQLMLLLQELNQEDKMTIFMITHDQEIADYAQRVLHLVNGKIVCR